MDPTRPLPRIAPLVRDPVRLQDAEDTDLALRRDLKASVDSIVFGIDYDAIEAELLARVATPPRDACG